MVTNNAPSQSRAHSLNELTTSTGLTMIFLIRLFLLLCVSTVASVHVATARRDGVVNLSTVGCGTCHGNLSQNTVVTVTGPTSIAKGATVDFTAIIAHQQAAAGGFNAAIRGGAGNAGTLIPGDGSRFQAGELTHVQAKNRAGADVRFPFQWTAPNDHGVYALTVAGNAVNGDDNDTDADDWNLSGTINLTVKGATFTAPTAGSSVCVGQPLTITWTQTGYQNFRIEQRSGPGDGWEAVAVGVAANLGTYTWTVPADADVSNTYQIRLVNATQGIEVVEESAIFTVNGTPQIVQQPRDTAVCVSRPFALTVGASGSNLQYRWKLNGTDIPGGTNAIYSVSLAKVADGGAYQCEVFGCGNVSTNTITVTINEPPSIELQPTNVQVCTGDSVAMEVRAQGAVLQYQWFKNGAEIPTARRSRYSISASFIGDAGRYYCRITGLCNPAVTSDTIQVSIREIPVVTSSPQDREVRVGDPLVLGVRAVGEELRYQWLRNGSYIEGETRDTLRVSGATFADSGSYECQVSNNCGQSSSVPARIRVLPGSGPGNLVLQSDTVYVANFPFCIPKSVALETFMQNRGGSNVLVTGLTTSDPSLIEIISSSSLPLTVTPGAAEDLDFVVTAPGIDRREASITIFSSVGNRILTVIVQADPGFSTPTDTIRVPPMAQGCATFTNRCATPVVVTSVRLAGPGSSAFELVGMPALPLSVPAGESRELCVRTDASEGEFELEVFTQHGSLEVVVVVPGKGGIINSVSELGGKSVSIAPNPTSGDVLIAIGEQEEADIDVVSIVGQKVIRLPDVRGSVRLQMISNEGVQLAPGAYLVHVQYRTGQRITLPVVVSR